MPDNNLKINLSADISELVAQLTNADSALDVTQVSVQELTSALGTLQTAALIPISPVAPAALAAALQKVEAELAKVGATAPEAAAGIETIVPAEEQVVVAATAANLSLSQQKLVFTDLGRIITGQGFSLRTFASNFGLLGPQIAIAGFAIYELVKNLDLQTDAEKKAAAEAKELKEELADLKSASDITAEATGSTAGNIARVQELAKAITDSNKSYKERNNALLELKETNKAYFGDLTLESATYKTLTDKVNDYSKALISEAIVKGQVDNIAKLSSELEKQVPILQALAKARDEAQESVDKQGPIPISAGTAVGGGPDILSNDKLNALDAATNKYLKQNEVVADLKTQISQYTDSLHAAIEEQLKYKPLQVDPHQKDLLQEQIDGYQKIIDALNKIKQITGDSKLGFDNQNLLNDATFNLLTDKIKQAGIKGLKDGLSPDVIKSQVSALNAELDKTGLFRNPDNNKVEKVPQKINLVPIISIDDKSVEQYKEDSGKTLDERSKKLPPIKSDVKIDPNYLIQDPDQLAAIKKLQTDIAKSLNNAENSGLENFGQSIGDAIAKGQNPIEAAGKSILSTIGDLVENLGKALIEYGTVKEGLDFVFSSGIALPGLAAIAIGVGAELIGSLIKNSAKSYKAFADGGIVTGPTYSLIGEAGPEVVFPLSKLDSFMKRTSTPESRANNVNVTGKISGRDLLLINSRETKYNNQVS